MQVSVETTQGLERKMVIAVPGEQVDSAVSARLQEAAKTVRLNGFRKGKIPFKVVKDKFGKGVRQEVVGELMNQSYYKALSQENLKPAGQPKIEPTNIKEGEDLQFTAIFEIYPEIALPDFSKIEVEKLVADIGDTEIDHMIETLRQQRQTWQLVEREAAMQDMVNMDYSGILEGEKFEGGEASGSSLVLGSERMIPGFEDGIVGKKTGESFTLPLEFPEKYHNKELAGKKVEFEITLNSVSEQQLPEVNEEFYASFGVEEGGVSAFREEVTNNMNREMGTSSRTKLKNAIMDALISLVDVQVPESLVAGEVQQLRTQAVQQMGGGNSIDPSMLPDELFKEQANRRVILGLVLGEVIKDQDLKADAVKVRETVEELASTYESPDEVINWYYGNQEQLSAIESTVVEDQVFDYIIDMAQITEKKIAYEEVVKPASAQPAETEKDTEQESDT